MQIALGKEPYSQQGQPGVAHRKLFTPSNVFLNVTKESTSKWQVRQSQEYAWELLPNFSRREYADGQY